MRSKGSLGNPLWNACVTAVSRLKHPLLLGPLRTVLSPKSGQICTCAAKAVMTFQCLNSMSKLVYQKYASIFVSKGNVEKE